MEIVNKHAPCTVCSTGEQCAKIYQKNNTGLDTFSFVTVYWLGFCSNTVVCTSPLWERMMLVSIPTVYGLQSVMKWGDKIRWNEVQSGNMTVSLSSDLQINSFYQRQFPESCNQSLHYNEIPCSHPYEVRNGAVQVIFICVNHCIISKDILFPYCIPDQTKE